MNTFTSNNAQRCGCAACTCQPCLCTPIVEATPVACACGDDCNCEGAEQGCLCN